MTLAEHEKWMVNSQIKHEKFIADYKASWAKMLQEIREDLAMRTDEKYCVMKWELDHA